MEVALTVDERLDYHEKRQVGIGKDTKSFLSEPHTEASVSYLREVMNAGGNGMITATPRILSIPPDPRPQEGPGEGGHA